MKIYRFFVFNIFFLYICCMKDKVIIKDEEELRYISELFNEKHKELNLVKEDLDCVVSQEMKLMMQPRCVTYSRVLTTPSLEHVFREVVKCLQPYMDDRAKSIILLRERFNFIVNVDLSHIPHLARSQERIEKFCRELEKLRFSFSWDQKAFVDADGVTHPSVKYSYSGIIFIGHVKKKDSCVYGLHINPMAVPYLTFIGKDMGRTQFDSFILDGLETSYSKRLYLILCDWAVRGGLMKVSLDDFKDMLGIADSYTYTHIRERVLESTLKQLEELGSDLHFSFDKIYDPESRRKPKVTGVEIFSYYVKGEHSVDQLRKVLNVNLGMIADKERRGAVADAVEQIVASGRGERLVGKFKYFSSKVCSGEMTNEEFRNVLLKIVRESYGIELRSAVHVRNSSHSRFRSNLVSLVE